MADTIDFVVTQEFIDWQKKVASLAKEKNSTQKITCPTEYVVFLYVAGTVPEIAADIVLGYSIAKAYPTPSQKMN